MTGLGALIRRRKAQRAKKAHGHGGGHGHSGHGGGHHGRKAGKASAAKRTPHPKPRTVAA